MKKAAFHNLGCKVNSYEMDAMLQSLTEHGYEIVPFEETADVYIVNTCTVTNIADRKSRQMLHKAKKTNPNAVVVAVGCYVQSDAKALQEDNAVDLLVGNNRKKDLVSILEQHLAGKEAESRIDSVIDISQTQEYEEMKLSGTQEHTRAYIKIQDGCNQFCSYCAIPYARGRVRSRKAQDVLEEISMLVRAGFQEFVLTGIHLSSYGIDFKEEKSVYGRETNHELLALLTQVDALDGVKRLRLGSLEPRLITEEFAQGLKGLTKLCPHFHLSLQSGCHETLKRMNRQYTPQQFKDSVALLRRIFEHPAITTDVIVGFPGETQEEFEETRRFLEEVSFYEMHIFKYSKRKGTKAADMKDQVPEQIKTQRSDILQQLEEADSRAYRSYYVGKEAEVLLEEKKQIHNRWYWVGHTREYVKIAVAADAKEAADYASNQMITGVISGVLNNEVLLF